MKDEVRALGHAGRRARSGSSRVSPSWFGGFRSQVGQLEASPTGAFACRVNGGRAEVARGEPLTPAPFLQWGGEEARTTSDNESGHRRGVARHDHLWKSRGKIAKSKLPSTKGRRPYEARMFAMSQAAGGSVYDQCRLPNHERNAKPERQMPTSSRTQPADSVIGYPPFFRHSEFVIYDRCVLTFAGTRWGAAKGGCAR
jgi:hypothetical protein